MNSPPGGQPPPGPPPSHPDPTDAPTLSGPPGQPPGFGQAPGGFGQPSGFGQAPGGFGQQPSAYPGQGAPPQQGYAQAPPPQRPQSHATQPHATPPHATPPHATQPHATPPHATPPYATQPPGGGLPSDYGRRPSQLIQPAGGTLPGAPPPAQSGAWSDDRTVMGAAPPATGGWQRASAGSGALPKADGSETIGGYRIERELARGGMGVVYVATNIKLGRRVALKVQLAQPGTTEGDRFEIEARAAARLSHPNIVSIFEVGEDAGRPFLAMELIEGQSLRDRILEQGPLEGDEAARIGAKMADALYYAHARAILHRDIKPHNILLDPSGEPQLTDFGLAKQVDSEDQGLTKTGQMMGTPAYMPPEQADGDLDLVDRRADVYSLGATLYEALTGQPPFQGQTAMMIVYKVLKEDPEPLRKLRPQVDADLETIVLKCLEKDLEQRYSSAKELGDDLRSYLAGEPIQARPVGFVGRLSRRARRNKKATRGLGALLAVVFLALGAGAFYANLQRAQAQRERDAADEARIQAQRARDDAQQERAKAEQAQEIAERARSQAVADGLALEVRGTLQQGYSSMAQGSPVEALQHFRRGRERLKALARDPQQVEDRYLAEACLRGAREALVAYGGAGVLGELLPPQHAWNAYCDAASTGRIAALRAGMGLRLYDPQGAGYREVVRQEFELPSWVACFCCLNDQGDQVAVGIRPRSGEGWQVLLYELRGSQLHERWRTTRAEVARQLGREPSQVPHLDEGSWTFLPSEGVLLGSLYGELSAFRLEDGRVLQSKRFRQGATAEAATFQEGGGGKRKLLGVGYDDSTLIVSDFQTGEMLARWTPHADLTRGATTFCAFVEPGSFGSNRQADVAILTAGGDGSVIAWSLVTGPRGGRLRSYIDREPRGAATVGALWKDEFGSLLAIGFENGVVRVWNERLESVAVLDVGEGDVETLDFVEQGSGLLTTCDSAFRRWRLPERERYAAGLGRFDNPVLAFAGGRLAYRSWRQVALEVRRRDAQQPLLIPLSDPSDPPNQLPPILVGLDLTRDGERLACTVQPWQDANRGIRMPGRVDVYDLEAKRRLLRVTRPSPPLDSPDRDRIGRPQALAGVPRFSEDGRRLLLATERFQRPGLSDSEVYSVPGGEPLARLAWHAATVSDAAWLGDRLVTVGGEGSLAHWEVGAQARLLGAGFHLLGQEGRIRARRQSGAGQDLGRWLEPGDPPEAGRDEWWTQKVGWSPPSRQAWLGVGLRSCDLQRRRVPDSSEEGLIFLAGSTQGELILWGEQGQQLRRWRAHQGPVVFCALLPDGRVVSASTSVRIWDPYLGGQLLREVRLGVASNDARGMPLQACSLDAETLQLALLRLEVLEQPDGRGGMLPPRSSVRVIDLGVPELSGFDEDPAGALRAALEAPLAPN